MKLSVTLSLLASFATLASSYNIDMCSPECNGRQCCTTATGPDDNEWHTLPEGYRDGLRYFKVRLGCCQFEEATHGAGNPFCAGTGLGFVTTPAGREVIRGRVRCTAWP
ncbi:hypothetical protein PG993_009129 [Apiospora rasikravindrae]|uniref:Uncharacterized protein n=1 Tax=Apiospora rasikravindrae TaxID=990691 RepID=A0ABR1SIN3_9PEZI